METRDRRGRGDDDGGFRHETDGDVRRTIEEETSRSRNPGENEAMSMPDEAATFTIELPESLLTPFAGTPEAFAREVRLAVAIEWYREGRVSQGKGAEIAGLSRIDFLDALDPGEGVRVPGDRRRGDGGSGTCRRVAS